MVIPAKVKRQLQEVFRRKGQPKVFVLRTFAAGITLLLKLCPARITDVYIDKEYPGNEPIIKAILVEMLRKEGVREPHIYFKQISRKSMAHHRAYAVAIKKLKPKRRLTFKQLVNLAIKK